jgi:hypothetical protein
MIAESEACPEQERYLGTSGLRREDNLKADLERREDGTVNYLSATKWEQVKCPCGESNGILKGGGCCPGEQLLTSQE